MVKSLVFCLLILSGVGTIFGQHPQVNFSAGLGTLFFIQPHAKSYPPGFSRSFGLNLLIAKKNASFLIRPGIQLVSNAYNSKVLIYDASIRIKQKLLVLNPEVLLKISKRNYIKAGLFFAHLYNTTIDVIYSTGGSGYYSYSNSYIYRNYSPTEFQAGITTGICFPFKVKNTSMKIDITVVQYAIQPVNSDYDNPDLNAGNSVPIMSSSLRPSVLMMSLEMALVKRNKDKKETAED